MSDLQTIRRAVNNGMSQETAITAFAGEKAKELLGAYSIEDSVSRLLK